MMDFPSPASDNAQCCVPSSSQVSTSTAPDANAVKHFRLITDVMVLLPLKFQAMLKSQRFVEFGLKALHPEEVSTPAWSSVLHAWISRHASAVTDFTDAAFFAESNISSNFWLLSLLFQGTRLMFDAVDWRGIRGRDGAAL
jgi:hypothetical protein